MSLRQKFVILVTGVTFAPILVFIVSFKLDADMETLRSYRRILAEYRDWRNTFLEMIVDRNDLESYFENIPDAVDVRLFDKSGSLLYAETPECMFDRQDWYHLTETHSVIFVSGDEGRLVVTRPPSPFMRNERRWYIPLTALLFITVMVIVIVQSINHSIGHLERATRKIAEGDLDFELPIRGNDKFASLTRSFDEMREHLKEEYAKRSRFIMGISHDLKTPLSSISGYANAIGEGYADTPEKLEKYVGIIEDKTKLLESRISMLIDYVRRETSEWKMNLRPVALKPFFAEIDKVFETEVLVENRSFVSRIELPDGVAVPMDEGMVIRAMENLLQNAVAYSPEGSTIRLSCFQEAKSVHVSLSNEGSGINSDELPHIFDPFVRGDSDRKRSGMGLGLSTVESVISSHGWSITASSVPDGTTEFAVTIPTV